MVARNDQWYGDHVVSQMNQLRRIVRDPVLARSLIEARSCLVFDAVLRTGDPAMAKWRPPVELDPDTPFDPDEEQPEWLDRLDAILAREPGGPGGGVGE